MDPAINAVFQLIVLVFSVVIHEVAHGLCAYALGDPTAKYADRLTLNPFKHLDPVGSVVVPLASIFFGGPVIGWAKPVPYNPALLNVRNQDLGSALVAAAGPAANISVAVAFGLILRASEWWAPVVGPTAGPFAAAVSAIMLINLILAVFNLVPIPPLDGSRVLFLVLPPAAEGLRAFLEHYGIILLLAFIFYFSQLIGPIVSFLFRLIAGGGVPLL